MRLFNYSDDLSLSEGIGFMPRSAYLRSCILNQAVLECETSDGLLQRPHLASKNLNLPRVCRPCCVARATFLSSLQELVGPAVIHGRSDALASAEFREALLAAKLLQNNPDLFFR